MSEGRPPGRDRGFLRETPGERPFDVTQGSLQCLAAKVALGDANNAVEGAENRDTPVPCALESKGNLKLRSAAAMANRTRRGSAVSPGATSKGS
jgi:hypothetical protein